MNSGFITIIILLITGIVSFRGFNDQSFFARYRFDVDSVVLKKEYFRLITSGFLHVGWIHLLLNLFSLFAFSGFLEDLLGAFWYLILYFGSLIGGNVLALYIHRTDGGYSSVGASGAICGVIFAAIALVPGVSINLIFIPIPGWLFGLLFVSYSIWGIRSQANNIGHEAHLGGGITGLFIALLIQPSAFLQNYIPILLIAVPTIAFIVIIVKNPGLLFIDNLFFKKQNKDFYSVDHKYNADRAHRQREMDRILEKIHRSGMNSLSRSEKEFLKRNSG